MNLQARILAAAVLLVAALIGMVVREDHARRSGQEILLPMEAVDPRGLLTGHYVALRLTQLTEMGQGCPPGLGALTTVSIAGNGRVATDAGESVRWIALTPSARGHRVTGGGATREAARMLGSVTLRGRASCTDISHFRPPNLTVDIGITRFHIAQKQAEAMERALRDRGEQPAYAIVSVGADGKARLKGVVIGGVRSEITWL